eukprot:Transcript_6142.p1 GENE.Transcript_6142~~Transcript_6142.p1  ORF type:complete len:423 (+),score=128.11 Transcript_6142:359-1627(+)
MLRCCRAATSPRSSSRSTSSARSPATRAARPVRAARCSSFNNVGGNGGGDGCCDGTTSYFPLTQAAPGAPFEPAVGAPVQGMVDWGAFTLKQPELLPPPRGQAGLGCLKCCAEPLPDGTCCCIPDGSGCPMELPPSCPNASEAAAGQLAAVAAAGNKAAATAAAAVGAGGAAPRGVELLSGTASRGLSMARTLGSEEADQVSRPGRRVLIGWTGPSPLRALGGQGSAQSLPRELSLGKDKGLRQRFVPELQALRQAHVARHGGASARDALVEAGLQAEVLAIFPRRCGDAGAACALRVLGDAASGNATTLTLVPHLGLVTVDATAQGNQAVRAGPLPPPDDAAAAGGWAVHMIIDHCLLEVIVANTTALVVYAAPASTASQVSLVGVGEADAGAELHVWKLASANNDANAQQEDVRPPVEGS